MRWLPPNPDALYTLENLSLAWYKVSRGKTRNAAIQSFYQNLDTNLTEIAQELRTGVYKPGPYTQFCIKDPKERIISASSVRDRIVQHALMNLYDPLFDRYQIFDSYACRKGKGTQRAVLRAFHFAKNSRYFLKMDVRKYFDSIDHNILKRQLLKLVKEEEGIALFLKIIDSKFGGIGLPIGNLTSQYFANHYLAGLDHTLKEREQAKKYLRYMDDILIFGEDQMRLKALYSYVVSYAAKNLHLTLKPAVLDRVDRGAPFLGFLIKGKGIYLHKKSKKRYIMRLKEIEHQREQGKLSERDAGLRIESVTAHLLIARSRNFRNTILNGCLLGLESRDTRRELEQQRAEPAFRQSEQQRSLE